MKCDNCGVRESTITIRETINSRTRTYHLCEVCASERGESFLGPVQGMKGAPKITFGFAVPANLGNTAPGFSVMSRPRVSKREKIMEDIFRLKGKQREVVEDEKYSEASEIRDKIEALKSEYRKEIFREKRER